MRTQRGFTMIELLVALVVAGFVGTALTMLFLSQQRFYGAQDAIRDARGTSRAALNVVLSDLRMVETSGGVVAAAADDITVRVPYEFGIVCTAAGGTVVASMLPIDSVVRATAGFSGWAYRDSVSGDYVYQTAGVSVTASATGPCDGEQITTLTDGRVVSLTPGVAGISPGTPVFLFQNIRYHFDPSAELATRNALWREVIATGVDEELVAPFQNTARFRFYELNETTAQDAVPALTDLRGIQLVLDGQSAFTPVGRDEPQAFDLTTAVFFKNRRN